MSRLPLPMVFMNKEHDSARYGGISRQSPSEGTETERAFGKEEGRRVESDSGGRAVHSPWGDVRFYDMSLVAAVISGTRCSDDRGSAR